MADRTFTSTNRIEVPGPGSQPPASALDVEIRLNALAFTTDDTVEKIPTRRLLAGKTDGAWSVEL